MNDDDVINGDATPPDDPIVRLEHARALGYCARGMRYFCATNGLDWETFLQTGYAASTIEATGDAMAQAVAALAREQQQGGEQ